MATAESGGGGSVTLKHRLNWTRTEFSSGSFTVIYESTSVGSLGYELATISSATTSYTVSKTVALSSSNFTRWYRVKHMLADGTLSAQSNQVSRTYSPLT